MMTERFNILLGVTGGIACYKACDIVSQLRKLGIGVDVVMTQHAAEFVSPLTFETLSGRAVTVDMFAKKEHWEVEHIALAKKADLCVIAPATANVIAKLANGIADDMLTTTVLALKCPILLAPAMNTNMLENESVQSNLTILAGRGWHIVQPADGRLACGDVGKGKLASVEEIVAETKKLLLPRQDLVGKTLLITAGATQENIDGVRYITNRSSGKMGLEIAKAAIERGGKVILVAGIVSVEIPQYITQVVRVQSTQEMFDATLANLQFADIIVKAAAPSDYRPKGEYSNKIKGDNITLELTKNPDIAKAVGEKKGDKKLVIFCAETTNLFASAQEKLISKRADMVVANDVTQAGAGFDKDTNIVSIFKTDGSRKDCPIMLKSELAQIILDEIIAL
ncbi:MAG: bifunctional phosphopantothenoylcysteine decarboxylase/phosphopantothenate--cysteine ligase CoaBC [Clostridia bacterium]